MTAVKRLEGLDGKVVVLTGATGMLGRAHADRLAAAGATLVLTDVDDDACRALATDVGARHGTPTLGRGADVTRPEQVQALLAATLGALGRVDVLVNNAAVNEAVEAGAAAAGAPFESFPLELWKRSLDVNLTGMFLCCQIVGGELLRRGAGSVVNVASTYGVVSPDQALYREADGTQTFWKSAAYPTTKAGVLGLTRYLACYFGPRGVRVNALSPGGVENGQDAGFVARYAQRTPLGRMARREEIADALVFLASDASTYVNGANLLVDGGWTAW